MHAASVHPEPGSNSRYHCIKTAGLSPYRSNLYYRAFALSNFTFCLSSILVWIVRDPIHTLFFSFVLLSCCSIFKDHLLCRFCGSFTIISQHFPFVKSFFEKNSKNFFSSARVILPSCGQLDYYTTFFMGCQVLFHKKMEKFSTFLPKKGASV